MGLSFIHTTITVITTDLKHKNYVPSCHLDSPNSPRSAIYFLFRDFVIAVENGVDF